MSRLTTILGAGLVLVLGCASGVPVGQVPPSAEPQPVVVDAAAPQYTVVSPTEPPPTEVPPTAAPTTGVSPTAAPIIEPTSASQPPGVPTSAPQPSAPPSSAGPADQSVDQSAPQDVAANPCDVTARPDPLPAPGSPNAQGFFRSFRLPLPPAPLYNPPGQKHVGLQAGHWLTDQVPAELGRLQGGAVGGGKQEWEVNLDVAQRAAALLEASGIQVDLLPATVPPHYQANAFIAIHADGDTAGATRGFKVARPGFSSIPQIDDLLVDAINQVYGADTQLPRDDEHISLRMRYYYAFNSRRYCHAVAPGVPQAIVEMAYLTNASDRTYLIGDPDLLARGIADSVQAFLTSEP